MEVNNKIEKQELVASLLSVRAGLSAISAICDEVNAYSGTLKEIEKNEKYLEDLEERIKPRLELRQKVENNKLVDKKECYRLGIGDLEDIGYINLYASSVNVKPKWFIFGGITCFIVLVLSFLLMAIGFFVDKSKTMGYVGLFILLFTTATYVIMNSVYQKEKAENMAHDERERSLFFDKCDEYVNKLLESKEKTNDNINLKLRDVANSLNVNYEQVKAEEILKSAEEKIVILKDSAKAIALAINVNYGNIINESDWENIDLILHYISTGRADNLKEALYQVDRQRQNETLVDAIYDSSAAICSQIQTATYSLAEKIETGFSNLRSSVEKCFEKNIKISTVNSSKIEAVISAQLESSKMTENLLLKANCTSLDMYAHYLLIKQ